MIALKETMLVTSARTRPNSAVSASALQPTISEGSGSWMIIIATTANSRGMRMIRLAIVQAML